MKTKRTIMSLVAATALCGAAGAQTLRVADVEALPGETVAFTLAIDVEGGQYSGFQFQMQFPAEGFATAGTTISQEWDGASFGVGDLDAAGQANGSAFSTSDTALPDGGREIGTVRFTVADDLPLGDYTVGISAFNFLDGTNYTPVDDVTFTVHVVSAHSVVLDENATTPPVAASNVNVSVKRTLIAGEWTAICLPFALAEEQVVEAFGEDAQVAEFTEWASEEDNDGNMVRISIGFETVTSMEANHPYLIKVAEDMTEFTLDGVDIVPEDEPSVQVGKKKAERGYMNGTYVVTAVPEEDLVLSDGFFVYSDGTLQAKAFSAYFELADALTDKDTAAGCVDIVVDGESVTTGIGAAIAKHQKDGRWYNLQGQQLNQPQKGLNISVGRKVFVR